MIELWLWMLGGLYVAALVYVSYSAWRRTRTEAEYLLAGSSVGTALGVLTFAATLFSTFTLMGMPDFFRTHGVGAWIFLAVSDGAMVFLLLWFGHHLRQRVAARGFRGVSGLIADAYGTRWAGYVYFLGAFLFLVPYVAIQIRGIAIFLHAGFPTALPVWGWSVAILVVMLVYSEIGGLKAIIYSDALQGLLLLLVTWLIAVRFVGHFGGVGAMFARVAAVEPRLLSTPGPQGLFTPQFLIASFLAILLLPVTQPQLTTRLVILRSDAAMRRMAVAVGVFTILIILPTLFIGMYGAVEHRGVPTPDFLASVLLREQPTLVGAAAAVGLVAAAMSTADSQIFALGGEVRSMISGDERSVLLRTKASIVAFGLAAMLFAILSSDELVLLARVSFAGTALLGPMVLAGLFARTPPGAEVLLATALALPIFLASLLGVVPDQLGPARLDLFLLLAVAAVALGSVLVRDRSGGTVARDRRAGRAPPGARP